MPIPAKELRHHYLRHDKKFPHVWCPGCGNGIVMGSLLRAISGLELAKDEVVLASGIGCSGRMPTYLDFNTLHTTHGRALTFATGIKLANPALSVIAIMGDGDATAIGGNHFIHAARRNLNLTAIIINNSIYGMTGGQMAPTSLIGMKTSTSPYGRDEKLIGYPLKITDMITILPGAHYVTRQAAHTAGAVRKLKKAIQKSFEYQKEKKGTCFIEVVSNCPSGWSMTPVESNKWMEENMLPYYPLGDLKVPKAGTN